MSFLRVHKVQSQYWSILYSVCAILGSSVPHRLRFNIFFLRSCRQFLLFGICFTVLKSFGSICSVSMCVYMNFARRRARRPRPHTVAVHALERKAYLPNFVPSFRDIGTIYLTVPLYHVLLWFQLRPKAPVLLVSSSLACIGVVGKYRNIWYFYYAQMREACIGAASRTS